MPRGILQRNAMRCHAASREIRASLFPQNSLPRRRRQASHSSGRHGLLARGLRIVALDAAMPFDFEHKAKRMHKEQQSLKIAIIGFGTFGQFLAKRLIAAGHQVIATSKSDYSSQAKALGVNFFKDTDDLCEDHPDVLVIATSIVSSKAVVKTLPVQRLRRSTLIVDVLSVKAFPKDLLLSNFPEEMDILCTHPMFGPDSGKNSWAGLNFMYEKVRIGQDSRRQKRVDTFLKFFQDEGCKMVEMSCEKHDAIAAETQLITHFVGRFLAHVGLKKTDIDTKGYEALLKLVENTNNDSFDLFYGLFMYNKNAVDLLNRVEDALVAVRRRLMAKLEDVAKESLFETLTYDAMNVAKTLPNNVLTASLSERTQKDQALSNNGSAPQTSRPKSVQ